MSNQIVHISDAKLIKPESVALVSYALYTTYNLPFTSLLFQEMDHQLENLEPMKVKYAAVFENHHTDEQLELLILQSSHDVEKENCSALVTRMFRGGKIVDNTLSVTHFYMRGWDMETVTKALIAEPQVIKKMDASASICGCSETLH